MSTTAIDYEALARQAGAVSSQPAGVDYAALAKQAGAVNSQPPLPPSPQAEIMGSTGFENLREPVTANKSDVDRSNKTLFGGAVGTLAALPLGLVGGWPLAARMLASGGVGAAVGGATEAMSPNPSLKDLVAGAGIGAGTYAGAELALPPLFRLAGAGTKYLRSLFRDVPAAPELAAAETAAPAAAQSAAPRPSPPSGDVTRFPAVSGGATPPLPTGAVSPPPAAPAGTTLSESMINKLGIFDPPPPALLTKAIKPLASNTGWNGALSQALPQLKAAEADLGRPIGGLDDALEAAGIAKKKLWALYSQKLEAASNAGAIDSSKYISVEQAKTIDGNQIADAMERSIDARMPIFVPTTNPDQLRCVATSAKLNPMSVVSCST